MRVVFIGTGEIGVPTLGALIDSSPYRVVGIVTQPDKPVGRSQRIEPPPIKKASSKTDIPVLQPERIKERSVIGQIAGLAPDVIVVMAYGQILPRELLGVPRLACLNLHASLLPRWRGAAPIQAAIAAGDRETGITVIYMDEGLDTGDILLQRSLEILPTETGGSLHDRLAQMAPSAILETLYLLSTGSAPRLSQDSNHVTYAPKLNRESGRIKWSEPADVIERKIRAFHPWPGAFTRIATTSDPPRSLKIFLASVIELSGPPGTILQSRSGLTVAAGKGALSLSEIQLEGKRKMTAAEFVRGFDVTSASLAAP